MFAYFHFRRKKSKKTNALFCAVVVLAGMGAAALIWQIAHKPFPDPVPDSYAVIPSRLASLRVDFGDGVRREFRGEVVPNMNVLEALTYATAAGNLHLAYVPEKTGVRVSAINGKKSAKENTWTFYVNGKKGEDPAVYVVEPGDMIDWKYE
ncbi:MAG: hypothetical protein Q8Q39_02890 [bacterium]|nr:hypothetical protein [bacterium]